MLDTPLMLWELSVTEQRYRAMLEVGAGVPVTEVAERYGVSRQSVHTWLLRYRQEGIAGMEDRSHRVYRCPTFDRLVAQGAGHFVPVLRCSGDHLAGWST
jgi:transposase-like protein